MNEKYDSSNNLIYYEYSNGAWFKRKFDSSNNKIYHENSNGDWIKREYDKSGNEIYYKDSDGNIRYPEGKDYYLKHRKNKINVQKLIRKYTKE